MPNDQLTTAPAAVSDNWMTNDSVAEIPFDQLFSDETEQTQPTTATQPETQTQQPVQVQVEQPRDFVIETKNSKYKTIEDAAKGIQTKDELIENLRQRYILERGVDPITNQPVRLSENPQAPTNYLQDRKRYMADLRKAVESNNEDAYFDAQAKLVFDLLQPIAPIIQDFAKQRAVQNVSGELKDFQAFRESPEFAKVLDSNSALRGAIQNAEGDFRMHEQLPELYRLAFYASQGQRIPELVKAAQQTAVQPQTQTRQPSAPSTMSLPRQSAQGDMNTSVGRKSILEQLRSKGIEDMKF